MEEGREVEEGSQVGRMDSIAIEPVRDDDICAVAELCREWAGENITRNYRADCVAELAARPRKYFLVARREGQVIGFIVADDRPVSGDPSMSDVFPGKDRFLQIQDIYVVKHWRSQGIGRSLVKAVLTIAKSDGLGCGTVYSSNRDYASTAHFYEQCGFSMWNIFMTTEF